MEGHQDAVARVDGYTLTIEHAAQLLAVADEDLAPPRPSIVDPLTDFWIGYTLLASELASPDTFSDVDLAALTQFNMDQELVWAMRDDRIVARVEPSDSELRDLFEKEQPYTSVEAYHILIRVPDSATVAQADSLKRLADSLRERALAGEDFEELARNYSNDPASASNGGRLGWVSRGRLVPELENVILHMQPGQISETVRSSVGYHIIRVTDRNAPDYESVRDEYRLVLMDRRVGPLEQAFIDSLFAAANVRLADGSVGLVRRMTHDPRLERLSPAERGAILARYLGGTLTLGEWADFVIRRSPNSRRAFSSDSISVAGYLRELVRNELLAKAARDMGYSVSESKADSLREIGKRDLFSAAAVSGLRRPKLVAGVETIPEAVDRIIEELLTRQRSPAPLERVLPALRSGHTIQVYPERFPAVIERLVALREARGKNGEDRARPDSPPGEPGS
jgi:hypothetical protein